MGEDDCEKPGIAAAGAISLTHSPMLSSSMSVNSISPSLR